MKHYVNSDTVCGILVKKAEMFETETKEVNSLGKEYQFIFTGKFDSSENLDLVWVNKVPEPNVGNKARLYITKDHFLK